MHAAPHRRAPLADRARGLDQQRDETRTGVSSWSELSLPPFSAVVVAVREADLFADGFESGDVAAWSGAAP